MARTSNKNREEAAQSAAAAPPAEIDERSSSGTEREALARRLDPSKLASFRGTHPSFEEHRKGLVSRIVDSQEKVRGISYEDASRLEGPEANEHWANFRSAQPRLESLLTPQNAAEIAAQYLHSEVAREMGLVANPDRGGSGASASPYVQDAGVPDSERKPRDAIQRQIEVSTVHRATFSDRALANLGGRSRSRSACGLRVDSDLDIPVAFVEERFPKRFAEVNKRLVENGGRAIPSAADHKTGDPARFVVGIRQFIKSPKYNVHTAQLDQNTGYDTLVPTDSRQMRAITGISVEEGVAAIKKGGVADKVSIQSPNLREAYGYERRGMLPEGKRLPLLRDAHDRFKEGSKEHDPDKLSLVQNEARGAVFSDLSGIQRQSTLYVNAAELGKYLASASGIVTDLEQHEVASGTKQAHLFVQRDYEHPKGRADVDMDGMPAGRGTLDLGYSEPGYVRAARRPDFDIETRLDQNQRREGHRSRFRHETGGAER